MGSSKSNSKRLTVLDGIRGLAILLVFFNHISSNIITNSLPLIARPVWETLTSSGGTGVALLFILSGFLMGYLYPQVKDITAFWQKRYTRIFPLFISLVITRALFRNFPNQPLFFYIGVIFAPALLINFIWVKIIQKLNNPKLFRALFWGFIFLQIIILLVYAWVLKRPAIYFNQQLPVGIRETIIMFVNSTLTLFMGDYIPMLDGVYWTLTAEVLFYLLYPIIFVPITGYIRSQKLTVKVLFLLSLVPLLLGLVKLSYRILGLYIINFSFVYFFIIGILLANIYRLRLDLIHKIGSFLDKKIGRYLMVLFLFFLILQNYLFNQYQAFMPLIRILSSFFLALFFIVVLQNDSHLSKIFKSRVLVFIGTISYSIYLLHTSVVDLAKTIYQPLNLASNILFISLTFFITCGLAYIFFQLLEKPYFASKIRPVNKNNSEAKIRQFNPKAVLVSIGFFYFALVFIGYQSDFNFFSKQYWYSKDNIVNIQLAKNQTSLSMNKHPKVRLLIEAKDNNFGIITFNLKYKSAKKGSIGPQTLLIGIKEQNKKDWYAQSSYVPIEIGNSDNHPFGFPNIIQAKGKNYVVELELLEKDKHTEYFVLGLEPGSIKGIYQLDKKSLIKNPKELAILMINKVQTVVNSQEARQTIFLGLPYLVLIVCVLALNRNRLFNTK